jgi:rubredoxin
MTKKKTELEKIEDQMKKLIIKHSELIKRKNDILMKTITLKCSNNCFGVGCSADVPIGNITYIATQKYDPDTGSPDGGFWREGEGNWICPTCKHRNRILVDAKKYYEMKYNLFKSWFLEEPDYRKMDCYF